MSEHEYNTVRGLPICKLLDPKHLYLLRKFAGDLAPLAWPRRCLSALHVCRARANG